MLIALPHLLLITLDCKSPALQLLPDSFLSCRAIPSVQQFIPYTHATLIIFPLFKMFILPTCVSIIAICLLTSSSNCLTAFARSEHKGIKHVHTVSQICAPSRQTWPVNEKWPLATGNVISQCQAGQMIFSSGAYFRSNLRKYIGLRFFQK